MIYYEYVEGSLKLMKNRGIIQPLSKIKPQSSGEKYTSLFGYDKSILDHIRKTKGTINKKGNEYVNGTVTGYNGFLYLQNVWIDIDNDDLGQAQNDALYFINKSSSIYSIPLDCYYIYFSGNKGFHIGLNAKLFGGFAPSRNLPLSVKELVKSMVASSYGMSIIELEKQRKGKNFKSFDLSIYNVNRVFRMPLSIHPKSNLFKIPIDYDTLKESSIEEIKERAETPIKISMMKVSDMVAIPSLIELKKNTTVSDSLTLNKDGLSTVDIKDVNGFFSPPSKGQRNNTLFKQACFLFDNIDFENSKLSPKHVWQIISAIDKASPLAIEEGRFKSLMQSAEERVLSKKNIKKKETQAALTLSDIKPLIIEDMKPVKQQITTGFHRIDKMIRGRTKGSVFAIIGEGGVGKSLLSSYVCVRNAEKGVRGLYCSMEMSLTQTAERQIDQIIPEDWSGGEFESTYTDRVRTVAASQTEEGLIEYLKVVEKAFSEIIDNVSDYLLISSTSGLDKAKLQVIYDESQRKYGRIKLVAIDGFSMMARKGNPVETNERNSKDLKDFAVENDVCMFVICHVPSEVSKGNVKTRRLAKYIRNGQKARDNFDGFISITPIETVQSSHEEPVYYKNVFCVDFEGKRFKGETDTFVVELSQNNLNFKESEATLAQWEFSEKDTVLEEIDQRYSFS